MRIINNGKRNRFPSTAYFSDELPELAENSETEAVNAVKRYTWIESIYEWCGAAIFSLICVVLAFIFLFRIVGVDGDSMVPTLDNGDRLIVSTFMYTPKRGDIVIIDRYTQEPLVKRVIAVAGDRIRIDSETGKVILNGVIMDESGYAMGKTVLRDFGTDEKKVPEGKIVVMGDNREISLDSRSSEVGLVNVKDVVGKALFRFLPLNKFGSLHGAKRTS